MGYRASQDKRPRAQAANKVGAQQRGVNPDSAQELRRWEQRHPNDSLRLKAAPPLVRSVLREPGQPLDDATRDWAEPRFQHDFSRVRVHSDERAAASARSVNALAYTVGQDIAFDTGLCSPHTPEGKQLLAHELAHTVQQSGSAPQVLAKQSAGTDKQLANKDKQPAGKTKYDDPSQDPLFLENLSALEVICWLLWADRYEVRWKEGGGGGVVVPNADIDFTGNSKMLPIVDVHATKAEAVAKAKEWSDVATQTGHSGAYSFYRGEGGVILPTYFSKEITPWTFSIIMKTNAGIRNEAAAAADVFRDLRDGMIIGAGINVVLRGLGFGLSRIFGRGAKTPTTGKTKPPIIEETPPTKVKTPGAAPTFTIRQRIDEFYKRLKKAPKAKNADEALGQVRSKLDEVEDELSGVPKKNPPPPPKESDGRMYPPLDDFIKRNADGSITATTRGHNIKLGADGSITITSRKTGDIEFQKP